MNAPMYICMIIAIMIGYKVPTWMIHAIRAETQEQTNRYRIFASLGVAVLIFHLIVLLNSIYYNTYIR